MFFNYLNHKEINPAASLVCVAGCCSSGMVRGLDRRAIITDRTLNGYCRAHAHFSGMGGCIGGICGDVPGHSVPQTRIGEQEALELLNAVYFCIKKNRQVIDSLINHYRLSLS